MSKSQLPNKPNPHNVQQVSVSKTSFYQGQLPPPEMMERYNNIDVTFANRIITMAENEAKHSHKIENRTSNVMLISMILGMLFAFASVLIVCFLVYFALANGFSVAASTIAVGVIVGIAGIFLYRKQKDSSL